MPEDPDDTIVVNIPVTSIKRTIPGQTASHPSAKTHDNLSIQQADMKEKQKKTELRQIEFHDGDEALRFFPSDLKLTMLREMQRNKIKRPSCVRTYREESSIYTTGGSKKSLFRVVKTDEQLLAARYKYGKGHQIIVVQERYGRTIRDGRPVIVVGTQSSNDVFRTDGSIWTGYKYFVWTPDLSDSAEVVVQKLIKVDASPTTQSILVAKSSDAQASALRTDQRDASTSGGVTRGERVTEINTSAANSSRNDLNGHANENTHPAEHDLQYVDIQEETEESVDEADLADSTPQKRLRATSADADYENDGQSTSSDSDTPLISKRDFSSPMARSPVTTARGRRVKPRIGGLYGESIVQEQSNHDRPLKVIAGSLRGTSSAGLVERLDNVSGGRSVVSQSMPSRVPEFASRPSKITPDRENISPRKLLSQAARMTTHAFSATVNKPRTMAPARLHTPIFQPTPFTPSPSLPSTSGALEESSYFVFKQHQHGQAIRTRPTSSCKDVDKLFAHARVAAKMGGWAEADILVLQAELDHAICRVLVVRGDQEDFDTLLEAVDRARVKPAEIVVIPDCD